MINFDVYPPELYPKTVELLKQADGRASSTGRGMLTAYGHAFGMLIAERTTSLPSIRQETAERIFGSVKQAVAYESDFVGRGMQEMLPEVQLVEPTEVERIFAA